MGRANDAHGDGLAHAKRIADREGIIADLHLVGIADRDGGEIPGIDLDHGNIRLVVLSDHASLELAAVGEDHFQIRGVIDYMVVGQDVAFRAHNHAGTETLGTLLIGNIELAAKLVAEELAEQRIHCPAVLFSPVVFTTLDDLMLTTVGTTTFTTGAKPVRLGPSLRSANFRVAAPLACALFWA